LAFDGKLGRTPSSKPTISLGREGPDVAPLELEIRMRERL